MLLPLWSLLDQPSPPPPPPPRPSDNSFIWGVGGGGGGGWPDHCEIERRQHEWMCDQIAYREHLRAMGLRTQGGMVRRARRLPRHTYVSSRRPRAARSNPAPSSTPTPTGNTAPAPKKVFHVGEIASAIIPRAGSAIAKRHRRRNGAPDLLVASVVGVGGFVATKIITRVAAPKVPRPITSMVCTTSSLLLVPKKWAYRDALIVGSSVATIDELLKFIA